MRNSCCGGENKKVNNIEDKLRSKLNDTESLIKDNNTKREDIIANLKDNKNKAKTERIEGHEDVARSYLKKVKSLKLRLNHFDGFIQKYEELQDMLENTINAIEYNKISKEANELIKAGLDSLSNVEDVYNSISENKSKLDEIDTLIMQDSDVDLSDALDEMTQQCGTEYKTYLDANLWKFVKTQYTDCILKAFEAAFQYNYINNGHFNINTVFETIGNQLPDIINAAYQTINKAIDDISIMMEDSTVHTTVNNQIKQLIQDWTINHVLGEVKKSMSEFLNKETIVEMDYLNQLLRDHILSDNECMNKMLSKLCQELNKVVKKEWSNYIITAHPYQQFVYALNALTSELVDKYDKKKEESTIIDTSVVNNAEAALNTLPEAPTSEPSLNNIKRVERLDEIHYETQKHDAEKE